MSDKNINILLTLQSKITGDLARVSRTLDKTKDSLQSLDKAAKQARRVAGDIAFIGTAISGVFGLALANAGKYSLQAAQANDRLTNTYTALQLELTNALLPTYNRFINVVVNVTRYIQKLDSTLKEKIVRIMAITAVVGVVIGVLGSFGARIISLIINVGKLIVVFTKFALLNPYIAGIIALIALLSYVTYKFATDWNDSFETKVIPALSKTESIFLKFIAGAQRDFMNLFKTINFLLIPSEKVFSLIGKIPGNKGFEELAKGITYVREQLDLLAQSSEDAMNNSLKRAGEVLSKNNGVLAEMFKTPVDKVKELKKYIEEIVAMSGQMNSIDPSDNMIVNFRKIKEEIDRISSYKLVGNEGFITGFSVGIKKSINDLKNFAEFGKQIAQKTSTAMSTYFSDSFFAIFKGDLESLQDAFSNFTDSVLRMISDIIAQYLTVSALTGIFGESSSIGKFLLGTKHQGGAIPYAHSGRAFDEVDVRLQKGEGVVSRLGMTAIGGKDSLNAINSGNVAASGGGQPVYISLQTWDASDILRNKKAIVSIIQDAITKNGSIRKAVQNA